MRVLFGTIALATMMAGSAGAMSNRTLTVDMEIAAVTCGKLAAGLEKVQPGARYEVLGLVLSGAELKLKQNAVKTGVPMTNTERDSLLNLVEVAFMRGELTPVFIKKDDNSAFDAANKSCVTYFSP